MKSDQMGTGHNNPSPRELPLSNQARFSRVLKKPYRALSSHDSLVLSSGGVPDARVRSSEWVFVLLCRSGDADPSRSSPENHSQAGGRRAGLPGSGLYGSLRRLGPALDPAGAPAAGDARAGVLLDPLRAPADGAAGLRSSVPLVCRARHRRSGLGPIHLFQEPRPAARRRYRSPASDRSLGAPPREAAPVA